MGCIVATQKRQNKRKSAEVRPSVVSIHSQQRSEQKEAKTLGSKPQRQQSISAGGQEKRRSRTNSICTQWTITSVPSVASCGQLSTASEAFWRLICTKQQRIASVDSSSSSALFPMAIASPSANRRTPSSRSGLRRFSIDTSRAKSNAPVVSLCARKLGVQEFSTPRDDDGACDIYWHSVVYPDMKNVVKAGGRVNKFPGMTELAKKISLTQAIRSMRELFPAEYSFYPQSWILPAQLSDFRQFCARSTDSCFIVKPDDGAQGMGIYLISSPSELESADQRQLVQEYVPDPYLLPDQLKFDLRVYAVIKSINPLSIFVAREGMARFCTEKYPGRPSRENFANLFAHLTNYSLNKASNAYMHSNSLREQLRGSKRLLSTVFHQMEHKGVRTRRLWREIKLIVVKTVLAMVPGMMLNYEHQFSDQQKGPAPQCFQILGFDILVRKDGTPVLLEVNSSPSLSVEHSLAQLDNATTAEPAAASAGDDASSSPVRSIVDEMIKVPLVRDCLLLVLDQLEQYYPEGATTKQKDGAKRLLANKENSGQRKWDIQSLDSISTNLTCSVLNMGTREVEDDMGLLRTAKRPHLSEIFPARYGQASRHLLVLDRAVYLYLQFVSIRQTLLISLPTIRAFLRKCELTSLLPGDALNTKFNDIHAYFFSAEAKPTVASGAPAIPFHGFLQILFHLARLKFGDAQENGLLPSLLSLLSNCDSALRRYGVRSGRLRRAELMDEEGGQNKESDENGKNVKQRPLVVKFYLLPGRMGRRPLEPSKTAITNVHPANVSGGSNKRRAEQAVRARSLPRKLAVK